jgi:hypothetical protein
MSTKGKVEKIAALAEKLPSGLVDPSCMTKFYAEVDELGEALTYIDYHGHRDDSSEFVNVAMEAGDCAYYAIKAFKTGFFNEELMDLALEIISALVPLNKDEVLDCCIAKMSLRAEPGNPKDDAAEHRAVKAILKEAGHV